MSVGPAARHVKFLALCHEGKVLASYIHWDKEHPENYEETLAQIFSSAGWSAIRQQKKSKLELKSGSNVYCMEIDAAGRVFAAVLTGAYPIRHIFSASAASSSGSGSGSASRLMKDFAEYIQANFSEQSLASAVGGLKKNLRPFLKDLAVRYDDLDAIDNVHKVQTKLNAVKATMTNNLRLADERQSLLEREVEKSGQLAESSKTLFKRTAELKRAACCQYYKMYCWIALVVVLLLVIGAGAILGINYTSTHWF